MHGLCRLISDHTGDLKLSTKFVMDIYGLNCTYTVCDRNPFIYTLLHYMAQKEHIVHTNQKTYLQSEASIRRGGLNDLRE